MQKNKPPLETLYLMPKSAFGPPGLWLAVRIIPPWTIWGRTRIEGSTKIVVFTNDSRNGRRWKDSILANHHLSDSISGCKVQDDLNGLAIEISPITTQHKSFSFTELKAVSNHYHLPSYQASWRGIAPNFAGNFFLWMLQPDFVNTLWLCAVSCMKD